MPRTKPATGSEPCHALHYLGDPSGLPHLSGIPSRDLSAAEVQRRAHDLGLTPGALVAAAVGSGLFTEAAPPAADVSPSADGKE